jgi:hypothetical protein
MPCANCKDVVDLPSPEMELKYHTTVPHIVGSDGNHYSLTAPLIPIGKKPRGGWHVTLRINGQDAVINGISARDVAVQAKKLWSLNSVAISNLDLWFNLNVLWIRRSVEKYQKVSLQSLLSLAQ